MFLLRRRLAPSPAGLVEEFLLYVSANISITSAENHRLRLKRFLAMHGGVPISSLTPAHADAYLLSLRQARLKPDTIYAYIDSLQSFEKFWRERYPKQSPARPFCKHITVRRPHPRPGSKVPPARQVRAMIAAANLMLASGRPVDVRDAAVFFTVLETGLRRRELASLTITCLRLDEPVSVRDQAGNEVAIYETAPLDGKTNDDTVDYTEALAAVFCLWLAVRPDVEHDSLFVSLGACWRDRRDCRCCVCRNWGKPLTPAGIRNSFENISKQAGLKKPLLSHAIRHYFGQRAVDTSNLELARQRLRHADIEMTVRYYAHQDDIRRKLATAAASLIAPPGAIDAAARAGVNGSDRGR